MAVGLRSCRGAVAGREVVREPAADVLLHGRTIHEGWLERCTQDPVTGDGRADLLQDLLRIAVFERIAHQDGEGRQDLPVRPAVAERVKPLPDLLHRALRAASIISSRRIPFEAGGSSFQTPASRLRAAASVMSVGPGRYSAIAPISTAPCSLFSSVSGARPQPGWVSLPMSNRKSSRPTVTS